VRVTNETPFPLFVHRDHLDDRYALVDATVKTTFERDPDGRWRFAREQLPVTGEPCDIFPKGEAPFIRERGLTEVTVRGVVHGGDGRPFRQTIVTLRAGDHLRRLRVTGRRWWRRRGQTIEATSAEPTDGVRMCWENAFGGSWDRPPGLLPNTRTPAPSTRSACAANPVGKGWVLEPDEVEGVELPQLEDASDPHVSWNQRSIPRCWAPMPADSSLRLDHIAMDGGRLINRHDPAGLLMARCVLNAPPELQLRDLGPGSQVQVEGFRVGPPLSFVVPRPAFVWRAAAGGRHRLDEVRLVAVHLDLDLDLVALVWHARLFAPLVRGEQRTFALLADRDALMGLAPR
jgi:hypothetical protein